MTGTLPVRAMTPDELRELMTANKYDSVDQFADLLGVHRTTVFRWLAGTRRIDRAAAALILSVTPKRPKK